MALPIQEAERIADQLRKFDSALIVKIEKGENSVVATTEKLYTDGGSLELLGQICSGWSVIIKRSGKNVRIVIY